MTAAKNIGRQKVEVDWNMQEQMRKDSWPTEGIILSINSIRDQLYDLVFKYSRDDIYVCIL